MDRDSPQSPIREKLLPLPGQHLDKKLQDIVLNEGLTYIHATALALALATGALAQKLLPQYPLHQILLGVSAVVTLWGAFGIVRLSRVAARYKLGRQGERYVGQLLQTLDLPGARVFHDIPTDRGNLDHVIVCDRGVYVIETKTWKKVSNEQIEVREGLLYRRGRRVHGDPVGQAAAGGRWLNRVLERETGKSYECKPVVVLPGWFVKPMDDATKGVAWVLEPKAMMKWIPREPVKLQSEDVRRVANAIGNYIRSRMEYPGS